MGLLFVPVKPDRPSFKRSSGGVSIEALEWLARSRLEAE